MHTNHNEHLRKKKLTERWKCRTSRGDVEIEWREFSRTNVICLLLLCSCQMNAMTTIYLLVKQPNWVKSRCYLFVRRSTVCMQGKQISEWKWKCYSIFACHNLFRHTPKWNEILSIFGFRIQQLELNILVYRQWIDCHIKRYKGPLELVFDWHSSDVWLLNCGCM